MPLFIDKPLKTLYNVVIIIDISRVGLCHMSEIRTVRAIRELIFGLDADFKIECKLESTDIGLQ